MNGKKKKKNQTHKQKDEKTTGMTLQTQLGCMRLWANRISISAWEGRKAGRREGQGEGCGGWGGGVTFGVGAAAVNISQATNTV